MYVPGTRSGIQVGDQKYTALLRWCLCRSARLPCDGNGEAVTPAGGIFNFAAGLFGAPKPLCFFVFCFFTLNVRSDRHRWRPISPLSLLQLRKGPKWKNTAGGWRGRRAVLRSSIYAVYIARKIAHTPGRFLS